MTDEVKSLLTLEGYYNRFIEYVQQDYPYYIAHRKVEADLKEEFGQIEHKGFKTYRNFAKRIRNNEK